ncbi:MAG TPA: VOC family protein, partial [Polyangiaceae bacterium]
MARVPPPPRRVLGACAGLAIAACTASHETGGGAGDGAPPEASTPTDASSGASPVGYTCAGPLASDGRPPICNLAHYAFRVTDLAKATAFYGDFLGLAQPFPPFTTDSGVTLAVYKINDGQFIELYEEPPPDGDTNFQLADIAFSTSDAEALRAHFAAKGVSVPAGVSKNVLGNTSFTLTDPDGHSVEWVQYEPDSKTGLTVGSAMPATRIGASVHHLGVTVRNPSASSAFYASLGFLASRTGPSAPLPADKQAEEDPNATVRIEYGVSPSGPPSAAFAVVRDHLCLRVADTLAAVSLLAARNPGIYVEHHVLDAFTVRANAYDPNGSRIELADSDLAFDGGESTSNAETEDLDSGNNDDAW